jgi:3-methyladenine DNA glycosylase AlkD
VHEPTGLGHRTPSCSLRLNAARFLTMPEQTRPAGASQVETFVTGVREALAAAEDSTKAPRMQAYMKSEMPYFGIPSPALKAILRTALAPPLPSRTAWEAAVRLLWDEATHREEWYAALALAGHRHYRAFQDPSTLPLYRHLVVTGAWWDVVDDTASRKVGPILLRYHDQVEPVVRDWAVCDEPAGQSAMWLRRTAVMCQLGAKHDTDLDLLELALSSNLQGSPYGSIFWIRKAVGWALRQHAKSDPDWVRSYVAAHDSELSGLSRREALKHL